MRWLNRVGDETGSSLVLVAFWVTALLALVGLAVDAAALYAERGELSRGADAVALAVAEDCATGAAPCTVTAAMATAQMYSDLNADDGAGGIRSLNLDLGNRRVTVETETLNPDDGSDDLDLVFMPLVGVASSTVSASAAAEWGYLASGPTVGFTFSDCEFLSLVGPDNTSGIVTVYLKGGANTNDCNTAGHDVPGGWGWLKTGGDCLITVSVGGWVDGVPGNNPKKSCGNATLLRNTILDKTVLVMYFDDATGQGNNAQYHVAGIGAFHVTAYHLAGQFNEPTSGPQPCSGSARCIQGYFTTVIYQGGETGGEDRGVRVVDLVG